MISTHKYTEITQLYRKKKKPCCTVLLAKTGFRYHLLHTSFFTVTHK